MIRRHNRCLGIRIWKWGRFQCELWFAPKGEFIEPHVHEHINSKIIFLAGEMLGSIGERAGLLKWPKDIGRAFHVPAGMTHSALVGSFCVFANAERWTNDEVTSAAADFTAV